MSLAETLAEDRRLLVLQSLAEASAYQLNEHVLRRMVTELGHSCPRDVLRADLVWLGEHGLLTTAEISTLTEPLWTATLTVAGNEVSKGRPHPGIRRAPPVA